MEDERGQTWIICDECERPIEIDKEFEYEDTWLCESCYANKKQD